MRVNIWETFRAILYAPFYAAFARRTFEEEGVDAVLGTIPPGVDVGDALRAGAVDVIIGGPMRVMVDHDQHPDSDLTCFCEVVTRDPFSLVGAKPRPNFKLQDLYCIRFATVTEAPTPWMCLQEDMRQLRLDPNRLARVTERTMTENAEALARGEIDVAQLFEPYVQQVVERRLGYVWYAAANRGRTTFTSFYARRSLLTARPEMGLALTRAIHRTQQWMGGVSNSRFAEVVAPFFPELPSAILEGAIGRYQRNRVWSTNPIVSREGFERQAKGLVSGGLIQFNPFFDMCVEMDFADTSISDAGSRD